MNWSETGKWRWKGILGGNTVHGCTGEICQTENKRFSWRSENQQDEPAALKVNVVSRCCIPALHSATWRVQRNTRELFAIRMLDEHRPFVEPREQCYLGSLYHCRQLRCEHLQQPRPFYLSRQPHHHSESDFLKLKKWPPSYVFPITLVFLSEVVTQKGLEPSPCNSPSNT